MLLLCSACLFVFPAQARQLIHFSSGTGFFLSSYGDFITNAHVIDKCQAGSITLKNTEINTNAKLIAADQQHDLALLRAERGFPDSARLAATAASISPGDSVMVMGYPQAKENLHDYKVEFAEVIDVKGPQGEPEWYQFTDSAQQGNSGGPLLDQAGNVIGVVTGKTELYRIDSRTHEQTLMQKSDIAVALPVLKRFLNENRIRFFPGDSRATRSADYIEKRARGFIAQVHCVTRVEHMR